MKKIWEQNSIVKKIIRILGATPIYKVWVMIIKDDKASVYNFCK